MKRILELAGAIYVSFALLAAHTALAPLETAVAGGPHNQTDLEASDGTLLDSQRLYRADEEADDYWDGIDEAGPSKSDYTVELWSSEWCGGCVKYKREELPALLKAGYEVAVRDYQKEKSPESVTMLPTVILYCKGKPVEQKVYWKAADIDEFVEDQLSDNED